MIQDFKNSNIGSRTVNEIISHLGTAQHILLILLCHCHKLPTNLKQNQGYNTIKRQAGTELGQAQLKLGLDFTLIFCRIGFSPLRLIELV